MTRVAAITLTNPISTMKYPTKTVVNTSKNASAHMCTTIQRQKSAITKFVLGVNIKPEQSKIKMLSVVYTNQFGKAHGYFNVITGFKPLNKITTHRPRIMYSNPCHIFPGSRYSHP